MRIKQALALAFLACNAAIAQQCPLQWVPSPQHGAPGCTLMPLGGLPWGPPGAPTRIPLFNWQRGGGLQPLLLARSEIPYYGLVFGDRMLGGLATWDGIRWQTLPAPAFYAPTYVEFNGELLVCGQGTSTDAPALGIAVARWDGTGWRAMGNGLRDPNSNSWSVGTAMAVLNGQLLLGGSNLFDIESHPYQVARWDGQTWHAMSVAPSELYYPPSSFGQRRGEWYSTWGAPGTNAVLKRWNGQSWVPANDGVGGLYGGTLLEFEDNLYLSTSWGWNNGSQFRLARRTETGWATVDNTGVAILSTPMGLIGTWEVTELPPWGRERGAQVIVWNGQGWSTLGEPLLAIGWPSSGPLVLKMTWYAGELVVSGSFTRAGNQALSGLARWDGSSWQPLGAGLTPSHGAQLLQDGWYGSGGPWFTDSVQHEGLAIVAGTFDVPTPQGRASHVAAWDGGAWQSVANPPPFGNGLRAATVFQDAIHVQEVDGWKHLARYADGEWTMLPRPEATTRLGSIAVHQSELVTHTASRLWAWNGSSWRELASLGFIDIFGEPVPLVSMGDSIVVRTSEFPSRLMRFDGTSWSQIPTGLAQHPAIKGLRKHGADLIAFGQFSTIGGTAASNIAAWDGAAWRSLGSGLTESVGDVRVRGADIFAISGTRLMHWNGSTWTQIVNGAQPTLLATTPDGVLLLGAPVAALSTTVPVSLFSQYFATPTAPVATVQSQALQACASEPIHVVVRVDGTPPFTTQWFRDGQPVDLSDERIRSRIDQDERTVRLIINHPRASDQGAYACLVTNLCSSATSPPIALAVIGGAVGNCDSVDFNNDCAVDITDIDAFLSVYSEGPCIPAGAHCNDLDFNNDSSRFDPIDIEALLRVFSEGPCE